jgi:formylglycine-generating enzyme required for sulfatase activity
MATTTAAKPGVRRLGMIQTRGWREGAAGACGSHRAGTTELVKLDTYCIDATEVTNLQWKAYAAASDEERKPFVPAHCAWNTTMPVVVDDSATDAYPRANVNFCDAKSYCAWAGKRLCGKIGGGSNFKSDLADPGKSQWYRACVGGGTSRKYPYGDTFDDTRCATGSFAPMRPKSFPECRGSAAPYDAVFDLSGNVEEWEDSCTTPLPDADTSCRGRGGGTGDHSDASCDIAHEASAKSRFDGLGFRCCKDL